MVTSQPNDKFAFLFAGVDAPVYVTDVNRVFTLLTDAYHYPASHIIVALGFQPSAALRFPDATTRTVTTAADLDAALAAFASAASVPSATALLYFTGQGISDPAAPNRSASPPKFTVSGTNTFDDEDLKRCLARFDCQLNVFMQQAWGDNFLPAIKSAAQRWTFTYAGGETYGDADGSLVTKEWVSGLAGGAVPAAPDNTGAAGRTAFEFDASRQCELISLRAAAEFAQASESVLGVGVPGYDDDQKGPYYLGLPELEIRDGNPWFESPDVYLTHPAQPGVQDDLYYPDAPQTQPPYQNTINVVTRNIGTHPVRQYWLGIQMVETGTGPALLQDTFSRPVFLRAGADDTLSWNARLGISATHACVRAVARLQAFNVAGVGWDITRQTGEAQRNIDPMPVAPSRFKEHEYAITNRFDTPETFHVFSTASATDLRGVVLSWFEKVAGELRPVPSIEATRLHFIVTLAPGESRTLVLRVERSDGLPPGEELRLPFSIAIEREGARAEVAGVTVVIRNATASVEGIVRGENGKPLAGANVRVESVDGKQSMIVRTDAKGHYALEDVSPDVYRITVDGLPSTRDQAFVLRDRERRKIDHHAGDVPPVGVRVRVVLDRIRVLDDHDRGRGKGEIVFNSVVVPDRNEFEKQVVRLPAKGAYHVSDRPGANDLPLGVTVFDGVVREGALDVTIEGLERDPHYRTENLRPYHRRLTGNLEGERHETVGDWALWYHVETA